MNTHLASGSLICQLRAMHSRSGCFQLLASFWCSWTCCRFCCTVKSMMGMPSSSAMACWTRSTKAALPSPCRLGRCRSTTCQIQWHLAKRNYRDSQVTPDVRSWRVRALQVVDNSLPAVKHGLRQETNLSFDRVNWWHGADVGLHQGPPPHAHKEKGEGDRRSNSEVLPACC